MLFFKKNIKKDFNPKTMIVTGAELITMLPRYITDKGSYFLYDRRYEIPYDPKYVMKNVPSYKYKGVRKFPDKLDCDKRVRIFRGLLAANLFGDMVAMETNLELLIEGILRGHSVISFLDINGERDINGKCNLVFGDPRTGKIIKEKEYKTYSSIKLRI